MRNKIFTMLFILMLCAGGLFAQIQPSCLFISKKGNDARDSLVIEYLEQSYDVTVVNDGDFDTNDLTLEDMLTYDFAFFSESTRTWVFEYDAQINIRTIPIPFFLLEGYMAGSGRLGWTTTAADTGYGTVKDSLALNNGNKVLILDNTGHDLSAGFGVGTEITVNSQAHATKHSNVTWTVPEIDFIQIAVSVFNPEWTVVMGVEAGTEVFNADGTVIGGHDSLTTQNRAALVGIHANVNEFITEDGYKLIDAGIEWVLADPISSINDEISTTPGGFALTQNYPNPFNPSTKIAFKLTEGVHTSLTVHNVLGQKVATLINEKMVAGNHEISFDATNLSSGIYFYQLNAGESTQVKKMILMK